MVFITAAVSHARLPLGGFVIIVCYQSTNRWLLLGKALNFKSTFQLPIYKA